MEGNDFELLAAMVLMSQGKGIREAVHVVEACLLVLNRESEV
jgi:hypothetical protein